MKRFLVVDHNGVCDILVPT